MSDDKLIKVDEENVTKDECKSLVRPSFEAQILEKVRWELEKLQKYEILKKDLVSIDVYSGPTYMRDFTLAYQLVSRIVASLKKLLGDAADEVAHQEAIAKLERAPRYFEEKGILSKKGKGGLKDSAALRDMYVQIDKDYREAKRKKNILDALSSYYTNLLNSYRMSHDDAKKVWDKFSNAPNEQFKPMSSEPDKDDDETIEE